MMLVNQVHNTVQPLLSYHSYDACEPGSQHNAAVSLLHIYDACEPGSQYNATVSLLHIYDACKTGSPYHNAPSAFGGHCRGRIVNQVQNITTPLSDL